MSPAVNGLIFAAIGACAAYGLRKDVRAGVAQDRIYSFGREKNPLGFAAILAGKVIVLALCLAEVLHAMNLCGDPMTWPNRLFG